MLALPVVAQEQKTEEPSPAQMQEMMKKWQDAMTPGEGHAYLQFLVGEWSVESRVWMKGPDGPPEITKGSSSMKPVLGGRFIRQDMKGSMMGKPMNGIGFMGYDNFKKAYVGFWIDNTSTALFTMEGSANADHTLFTLTGKADDPMTGEKDKPVVYIWRVVDKSTHVFEIHDPAIPGGNTKVVEMTYRKKK
jgi:hypothetical protein